MAQENKHFNLNGSGQILAGVGILSGMYVNSTSSGTVKIYDNLAATGTIIFNTITPAVGYHNLGDVQCLNGCYASISNTLDVTFFIKQTN